MAKGESGPACPAQVIAKPVLATTRNPQGDAFPEPLALSLTLSAATFARPSFTSPFKRRLVSLPSDDSPAKDRRWVRAMAGYIPTNVCSW